MDTSSIPTPAPATSSNNHANLVHLIPVRTLRLGGLIGAKVPALCGEFISTSVGDDGETTPSAGARQARGEVCPTCELLSRALPSSL